MHWTTTGRPVVAERVNFTWGRLFIPMVVPPPVIGMFLWNWKVASVWLIAVVAGARRER
jgi:hypothetical protein